MNAIFNKLCNPKSQNPMTTVTQTKRPEVTANESDLAILRRMYNLAENKAELSDVNSYILANFSGDANRFLRQSLMKAMTKEVLPLAKCGVTAIYDTFIKYMKKTTVVCPDKYNLSHYTLGGMAYAICLFIPKVAHKYDPVCGITRHKMTKIVRVGDGFDFDSNSGSFWLGNLTETRYDYTFFPKQKVEDFSVLSKHVVEINTMMTYRKLDTGSINADVAATTKYLTENPRSQYVKYLRPESPLMHPVRLHGQKAKVELKTPPVKKVKKQASVKPVKGALVEAKNVVIHEELNAKLEKCDTVAKLKNVHHEATQKKCLIISRDGKRIMASFEKVQGKTSADCISYNDGEGKVRVCFIHKYFVIAKGGKA